MKARTMPLMHTSQTPPWYVLTGGPCSGKTTTLAELERRGYHIAPEAARLYFEEGIASGRSIEQLREGAWLERIALLTRDMHLSLPGDELYLCDRGVPDSVAYYETFGAPVDDTLRAAMAAVRYRKVFLLDLIDYEQDAIRTETPEEAMILHGRIREAYVGQGYEVIEIPVVPVAERADMIISHL